MPVTGQRVVRRALGRRLARLRVARGLSRRDVAEAKLGMSEATLHRIEAGKVPVTAANVRALCWMYRVDQSVTDALAELAVGTSHEEWWDTNPVIPDWFKLYVGLEASAQRIRTYSGEAIPTEVQTKAYAAAVFDAQRDTTDEDAQRHVKLLEQRQRALLGRDPSALLTIVLGEGALIRPFGGLGVLTTQLEHLRSVNLQKNVEIWVLPFAVGGHAAIAGAFRILDFEDPEDPDVVYLESHLGALYLEEPDEVAEYRRIFELIKKQSVPLEKYSPGAGNR